MGKKKTDVKPDPSAGKGVNTDPPPVEDPDIVTDPPAEGDPPVEVTDPPVEDDRPDKNRIAELERRLSDKDAQNQQLLDSVFDMQERQRQSQPQEVQVPAEITAVRDRARNLLGADGEALMDDMLRAAGSMSLAQVDQKVKESLPGIQSNLDMAQEARVDQMAAKNPKITPYTGEVMDILKQTAPQTRLREGVVEQAVALVLYRHDDEIEKRSKAVIKKEVEKRRKVDGESELSGTSVTVDGKDVLLSPEVRDLGQRMGKSDEWMAEAMAAHTEKVAAKKR